MKTKINSIIILGFLVAITPWLGFPQKFKNFLSLLFGLLVFILAYLVARQLAFHHARAIRMDFDYAGKNLPEEKTAGISNDTENAVHQDTHAEETQRQNQS